MPLPRFRLRTLMIAVAVVAMLLVLIGAFVEALPGDFAWISIGGHTVRVK